MRITVIIPTCNRAEVLSRTLAAYARQTGDHRMREIIVVDDGSSDRTRPVVEEYCRSCPIPVRYLWQQNRGAAAARNRAIRESTEEVILFGDDDVIPSENMVAEHAAWHSNYPESTAGMLGHVTWAPEVRPTPFMAWSGLYGPQFKFGYMTPGSEIDFLQAYTCNLSIKRALISTTGMFDERIPGCGWEDVEFAYRLYEKGCRVRYNPRANGFHYKFETFEDTRRRVERWYESWPIVAKTEAGAHILKLWAHQKPGPSRGLQGALKNWAKALMIPLVRPFVDTRLPLPGRLYDMTFSYYVRPLPLRLAARGDRSTDT